MEFYLRKATEKDMDLLFQWANDPIVRTNSFTTEPIPYQEHCEWYKKLLTRTDCHQYIYMQGRENVGQVRIIINGNEAEISYSICREKRCMGHGKRLIQLLGRQVKIEFPDVKKLTAKVKADNIASRQAFLDVGYMENYLCYELDMTELETSKYQNIENTVRGGVLFLTNNSNSLNLYYWLKDNCDVQIYSEEIYLEQIRTLSPDLIISYNYKYLIKNEIIEHMKGNVFNLHISYLPWNRGADPNIWSFIEKTPKGVTIHQVDQGLDTGQILFQRECFFDLEKESFASTYNKLHEEITCLFKENWEKIQKKNYILYEQQGTGSHHKIKDLELLKNRIDFDWTDNIAQFLKRYNTIKNRKKR